VAGAIDVHVAGCRGDGTFLADRHAGTEPTPHPAQIDAACATGDMCRRHDQTRRGGAFAVDRDVAASAVDITPGYLRAGPIRVAATDRDIAAATGDDSAIDEHAGEVD